jgi:hypothetical protein
VGNPASLNAVADAGYFNGEQVERCEAEGIVPHVPANRSVNNQGGGKLFDRTAFVYDEKTDTFRCPAQQTLTRKQLHRKDRTVIYEAKPVICASCPLKANCTTGLLLPRDASAGTRQSICGRASPVEAATSLLRCGNTRLPAAAKSGSAADTRTGTASTDRADRSPVDRFRLAPHEQNPAPRGSSVRRMPR